MKKILAFALLGLFLYQFAGIFVLYRFEQQAIRKEIKKQIKEGVPESELHVLNIDKSNYKELIWHNHKEFMFHGTMYDIVQKTITGNYSVTFQCVNDRQETELFASLNEQVDRTMDSKHQGKHPIKLLMLTFFDVNQDLSFSWKTTKSNCKEHSEFVTFNSDKHILIFVSPPENLI
ncbi:MAG: hypothetical protein IPM77_18005 [Crocinitomicaceae bacterium]|nr:hypothetical protein [Bacteroidota bacterium]MBK9193232.1 hypothetical protein [Crocinitomicaceae bacterium]